MEILLIERQKVAISVRNIIIFLLNLDDKKIIKDVNLVYLYMFYVCLDEFLNICLHLYGTAVYVYLLELSSVFFIQTRLGWWKRRPLLWLVVGDYYVKLHDLSLITSVVCIHV